MRGPQVTNLPEMQNRPTKERRENSKSLPPVPIRVGLSTFKPAAHFYGCRFSRMHWVVKDTSFLPSGVLCLRKRRHRLFSSRSQHRCPPAVTADFQIEPNPPCR